jgi:predicted  nucleic acid-binding Zn-ribbon protein
MTATTAAQEHIDTLRGKLDTFETQITTLHNDILEKRTAAAAAMLEGRDVVRLEDDISRLESRFKTIEFAKATAQTELSEAKENLNAAKRTDAQERIREIRKEVDQAASALEEILKRALSPAQVFEGLLKEAWSIHENVKLPLSPLGSWVSYSGLYNRGSHIDFILGEVLERLSKYKPKE